ncbi:MAG: alpha/beta hydrolase, partial [Flavobacteriales bacterium]|nr:alpha/beta hydrolase [Flavobacteriales bacterium]
ITVPTLIITGSADDLIPPCDSEAMARAIPGSVLVTLPGVGHLTNLEDPEGFNAAVRGVLEQVA